METLHMIGLSMLLFAILPNFDVVRGAIMFSSVCTVPSLIRLFVIPKPSKNNNSEQNSRKAIKLASDHFLSWFIFILQLVSLAAWTIMDHYEQITGRYHLVPIGLFLVSFEWWENFLVPNQMCRFVSVLESARKDLQSSRYFISLFIAPWKCILFFCLMILHEYIVYGSEATWSMFHKFFESFQTEKIKIVIANDFQEHHPNAIVDGGIHYLNKFNPMIPMYIMFAHMAINYLCYWFAKYACKICIQSKLT